MSDPGTAADRKLRRLSLANLSRMGHCAPAIMQTMLDASELETEWLVRLTAGLPGGIGNTGGECGGVTAPLELADWFKAEFGSTSCRTLTRCDFSTREGVRSYVENDGTTQCRAIAAAVARRTQGLIREREATMA